MMLKVSRAILSVKLVYCFTRRLETGLAGTGCCALPLMANSKRNKIIQPKYFNSSSFSDMVKMRFSLIRHKRYKEVRFKKQKSSFRSFSITNFRRDLFFSRKPCHQIILVHPRNIGNRDFFRANRLAGAGESATAKTFLIHLRYHTQHTVFTLRLTLW